MCLAPARIGRAHASCKVVSSRTGDVCHARTQFGDIGYCAGERPQARCRRAEGGGDASKGRSQRRGAHGGGLVSVGNDCHDPRSVRERQANKAGLIGAPSLRKSVDAIRGAAPGNVAAMVEQIDLRVRHPTTSHQVQVSSSTLRSI